MRTASGVPGFDALVQGGFPEGASVVVQGPAGVEKDAFLFQFDQTHAFIGLSPELLYKREDKSILTEAIAGTRGRGIDFLHDDLLRQELLTSEKDRHEHHLVVGAIIDAFRQVCRSYRIDNDRRILRLPNQQHLCLRISGRLGDDIRDRDLCSSLHPTPAVGGAPADKAQVYLRQWEGFDRGWFSGAVGCLGLDRSEVAVAIRSCLVEGSRLNLYAGAGIVNGSDPRTEWEEIESKIKGYLNVLYSAAR